jgi:DNA-binding SARP family transcriptional activator
MDHLEFRLLGSIDACVGGRSLEIGPRKRRYVLAALLLDLNRPVPVERLIDAVWEGDPPDSARMTVQGHVYRPRRVLTGARLAAVAELACRRLRLGRPERAVAPLRAIVTAAPHQERLVSLLMTALYLVGRQAEALGLYKRTRRRLADQRWAAAPETPRAGDAASPR